MKKLLACALLLTPLLALAAPDQPVAKDSKASTKTAKVAKSAKNSQAPAPAAAKKSVAIQHAKAVPATTKHKTAQRTGAAATAAAVAAAVAATEADAKSVELAPEQMAIAEQVHTGAIACELGASVNVAADPKAPGRFNVTGKGFAYHMTPVSSATGAIRLEDTQRGAVWLQIANKSMLMNQKLGQRLADECMSPAQVAVAQAMKTNPPPSLLDKPAPAEQ
ncbi:MAG: hypothetical protein LWW82_08420 [Comamonadaceae bacterium]|nr:hypothetical protein [Comamonadaceae bacterium]